MVRKYQLKKIQKIKAKDKFQQVYETGHSVVDPLSVLYFMPTTAGYPKIGLAVGKKIGNAVVRNHVKRLMREVFRHKKHEITASVDLIWVARQRLAKADVETYERVFMRLAKRANIV